MSHDALTTLPLFDDILNQLEEIARQHLLNYRVQVGRLLLRHFWNNDAALFSSRDNTKEQHFELFFATHAEDLARLGLSKRQARDSIRASIVMQSLPASVREQLFLSEVLELTRLHDASQRKEVAEAAVAENWSVARLRAAVTTVRAGLPLDLDPDTPWVQLPEVPTRVVHLAPGRMVTRGVKLAARLDAWVEGMATVNVAALRPAQRRRMAAAVATLEARVAALKAGLAKTGDE